MQKLPIINTETAHFIATHRNDDVSKLALSSCFDKKVDRVVALQQISGWQCARQKIPSWAATEGIIYPPHINMEQCSSEVAAQYKASIAKRLGGNEMTDLTGGLGVDFSFLAPLFENATYVEQNEDLCTIAKSNFPKLGICNARIVCSDAIDHLQSMSHVSLIFIDPARRDTKGKKTFAISDCQPDISQISEKLLEKADNVIVKLSPMLDWHAVERELPNVSEIHIVSVKGECKELIAVMSSKKPESTRVYCVEDDSVFTFLSSESAEQSIADTIRAGQKLYEPNASVMKSGEWGLLCKRYNVKSVANNSHLFIEEEIEHESASSAKFPGRKFEITAVSAMNRQELKTFLSGVSNANIAVRNFPMSAVELRRRLKLADGGDNYIFATTDNKKNHILIMCKKTN